jgi:methylmalonyl-CoA/ethylmalonyl-CoA epimerase
VTFDHIGIVTANLSVGREFLKNTLSVTRWTQEFHDAGIGVTVQFGKVEDESGPWYELVTPLGDQSPVAATVRSGKNILNHLAYLVASIDVTAAAMCKNRCFPIAAPQSAVAYGGRRVQFFVSPLNFIIELIESPCHRHKEDFRF